MATVQLLTVSQVAELLQMHPVTIRNMARIGKLPAQRIGRRGAWRFDSAAIDRMMKQRTA